MTLLEAPLLARSVVAQTTLPSLPGHETRIDAMLVHGDRLLVAAYHVSQADPTVTAGPGALHVLDRVSLAPLASPVAVGERPSQIVVNSSARRIHVFNHTSADISVIDLDTLQAGSPIPVGFGIAGIAVDTTANVLFVLQHATGEVIALDGTGLQELRRHPVGPGLTHAAVDEAGRWLYVSRFVAGSVDQVDVVDTAPPSDPPTAPPAPFVFARATQPRRVAFDPAGNRLYVWVEGAAGGPTSPPVQPGVVEIDLATRARRFVRVPGTRGFALDDYRGLLHAVDGKTLLTTAIDTLAPLPSALPAEPSPQPVLDALAVDIETSSVAVGDRSGRIRLVQPELPFGDVPLAPVGAPITVVGHDDQLDVFVVGTDDRLRTAHWSNATDWDFTRGWTELPDPLAVRTPVAAISRTSGTWELFTVRPDGQLWALQGAADGATTWELLGGTFPGLCEVAAVTRFPGERTVFAIADDGVLHLYGGAGATEHVMLDGGPVLTPGTPIAATSRKSDHWDVFVLAADGQVWTNWWGADSGFGGWSSLGGSFPPGTPVTAISRGRTDIELFAVRDDGQVVMQYWHSENGWSGWFVVADSANDAPLGSRISAVGRADDHLDIFVVKADRQIHANRAHGGWSGWHAVGGRASRPGAPLAVAARGDWVHVCWGSDGGSVETAWWHPRQGNGGWSLDNGVRMRVPTESVRFSEPVETDASLGGNVVVRLWRNGAYLVDGHMHGSGFDPYRFVVQSAVHAENGVGVVNHRRGRVDGTGSEPFPWDPKPDRDHDWLDVGLSPVVEGAFDELAAGAAVTSCEYKNIGLGGGITGIVETFVEGFLEPFILAPTRRFHRAAGFIGHELNELLGFVPNPQSLFVYSGAFAWLPGLHSLIPALPWDAEVGGALDPYVDHRQMTEAEWEFADLVFQGTLPDRETILLTNALGIKDPFTSGDGRAFVFPSGTDGPIIVNIGSAFDDPVSFTKPGYDQPGQLFIHELTHVWHIHNMAMSRASWTSKGISDGAYDPPPAGTAWTEFGIEAKASTVDRWYAEHHAAGLDTRAAFNDPYYPYIHRVRTRETGD